jgi:beta-galactosidase/beta-glucuronidase
MTLSLSGDWRYSTKDQADFAEPGFDDSSWKTMHIPQNWFLDGLDHHGVVWFRREFNYKPRGKFTSLHFEGVDYFADVTLNGSPLGHHTGYFTPFIFDVTGLLRSGKNILAVRVDSPYEQPGLDGWHIRKKLIKGVLNHHDCRPGGGWNTEGQSYNTGGIWNSVHLEQHGAVTIDEARLRSDLESQPSLLHIQLKVKNRAGEQAADLELRCTPENFTGNSYALKSTLDIPAGESVHSIQLAVPDIRLWQPWDRGFPHLYQINTKINAAGKKAVASSLFGFRTVKLEEGFRWFVNGKPYFIRGSNYIGSQWLSETLFQEAVASKTHPFGGGPEGDFYKRDVELARQANLNLLRVHAHVLPPEFHAACDRAGILVWQDFPLQWGYSDQADFRAEAEREMRAMVTQLYNHPSIVAWCAHNESPWDAPWMAGAVGGTYDPDQNRDLDTHLQAIAREIGPDRYAHRSSGTGDGHTYPGWYHGHWRDYRDLPGAPFITEYGAQGLPGKESFQRMLPQFGPDAGFAELLRLKTWIESNKKIDSSTRFLIKFGTGLFRFMDRRPALKRYKELFMKWGMKRSQTVERSIYQNLPSEHEIPADLQHARQVWQAWQFHDTQLMETFENGIKIGTSLADFIINSQSYQAHLIQYGTECYRRAKYEKVTGIVQFDFTDPWPAVTWAVLDYWRHPKAAYDALRRCMQPVLPSIQLPENIEAGKATLVTFCVVNDLTDDFPNAQCTWQLSSDKNVIASASFPVNIPADGISKEVKVTLPSLNAGQFRLNVSLSFGSKILGENWYEIDIDNTDNKRMTR